jgi:hypothetical protein
MTIQAGRQGTASGCVQDVVLLCMHNRHVHTLCVVDTAPHIAAVSWQAEQHCPWLARTHARMHMHMHMRHISPWQSGGCCLLHCWSRCLIHCLTPHTPANHGPSRLQ